MRIVPRWEIYARSHDRVNIVIEPGPAFGIGDHPSTVMALELLEIAMEDIQEPNEAPSVLDVGTGTGILAIAARSLGAGLVVALDTDLVSVLTICTKNVELNDLNWEGEAFPPPCFFVGELAAVSSHFQIVMANLAAPVLLRLRDNLVSVASCYLILSGIADEMIQEVRDAYCNCMDFLENINQRGWNSLLLRKQ